MRRIVMLAGLSVVWAAILVGPDIPVVAQTPTPRAYFPGNPFGDFWGPYYTSALEQMGEAPLALTRSATRETYRFLWLPSFDAAAAVRVEREGNRIGVSATRLPRDGSSESRWGKPERSTQKTLSANELSILSALVSSAKCWDMPSKEPEKRGFIQVDGDTWILEVADERRHHVAARWYHEDYPDFAAACYCMLEWSGLRQTLDDIEGYGFGARQRLISRCARR